MKTNTYTEAEILAGHGDQDTKLVDARGQLWRTRDVVAHLEQFDHDHMDCILIGSADCQKLTFLDFRTLVDLIGQDRLADALAEGCGVCAFGRANADGCTQYIIARDAKTAYYQAVLEMMGDETGKGWAYHIA